MVASERSREPLVFETVAVFGSISLENLEQCEDDVLCVAHMRVYERQGASVSSGWFLRVIEAFFFLFFFWEIQKKKKKVQKSVPVASSSIGSNRRVQSVTRWGG